MRARLSVLFLISISLVLCLAVLGFLMNQEKLARTRPASFSWHL